MRSKRAMYNILSNLILQIVIVIYGFIIPKIIISSFGSSVNGLISSITQFLAYISLLESGFGPVVKATLYKPIADKDHKTIANILKTTEKFFRTIAYIFLVYIVVLSFLYPLIVKNDFGYFYTISLIVIIAISTFAEYFFGMTYRLYLQANQKNYIISIIQIFTYIVSTILIVICAKLGFNIHVIKLVSGLIFVLRPIFQNIYVKKMYHIKFDNCDDSYELKQKWDALGQHIAAVIHGNTDITVLTFFCKLSEVSVYSVYYLVVKGIKSIIQAFTSGIEASFGDMIAKGEQKNLNRKFNIYEVAYFSLCTVIFICAMVLIVPFISVYTKGIKDANYMRYTFGYLIVISEFIWAIRLPYSSLTFAAGHFKETRAGAWVEAIVNIVLSIILVSKFGIVGVAIGTIVAMSIRTIEFIIHTNKYILKRNIFISIKKIILIVVESILCVFVSKKLFFLKNISYVNWVSNAIIIGVFVFIVVFGINFVFCRSEFKSLFSIFQKMLFKKKKDVVVPTTVEQDEIDSLIIKNHLDDSHQEVVAPKPIYDYDKDIKFHNEEVGMSFMHSDIIQPTIEIEEYRDSFIDEDSISSAIRNDNSVIRNIDFDRQYDFDIVKLLLNETRIYGFKFYNDDYLRDGRYPVILSNSYQFMRYVIDYDVNYLAYIDISSINDEELMKIIDYACRKVYFAKKERRDISFDLDGVFSHSDIIHYPYFQLCLKYL